jgi:hypothetical protein
MAAARCKAKTKSGKRCKAYAVKGSDYCAFHEPGLAGERATWRRAGGRQGAKKAALEQAAGVQTAAEVKQLLGKTIELVRRGEMDPSTANAIARLCNLQLKAIRETDYEQRLQRLEQLTRRDV